MDLNDVLNPAKPGAAPIVDLGPDTVEVADAVIMSLPETNSYQVPGPKNEVHDNV